MSEFQAELRHNWQFSFTLEEVLAAARCKLAHLERLAEEAENDPNGSQRFWSHQGANDLRPWVFALEHKQRRVEQALADFIKESEEAGAEPDECYIRDRYMPTYALKVTDIEFFGLDEFSDG